MNRITIELTPEQAMYLTESVDWSIQATEKTLMRNEHNTAARAKWEALDDINAQLQEQKRINWYGQEVA